MFCLAQASVGTVVSMTRRFKPSISDIIFGALSLALAAACIFFAGYMVIRLQNMEDPPADMGLNFPPKKERRSEVDAVLVDPLATGSIDDALSGTGKSLPRRIVQPYTNDQPVLKYQLLSVIDGIAFVEVTKIRGTEIWPVREGSILPGAGQVEIIEKVAGRWRLATDKLKLEVVVQ